MEELYKKNTSVGPPNQYYELATECLICGESVPVFSIHAAPKVCEKCKAVVLKLREQDKSK